ncbi:MurR/RpiR family transcriptional regulator [Companilactobacillus halodurans]|uniref:MurR/RpiR family transcriptional regulator n=1 Tax=Companilactobacillus halodurans TaxID=2584183 RepID=A0A5P0ZVC4_9LACO|nr:MurR/RpiR family transcriptional regulator [Companilactobacillus halodurans]MQS96961.1 MurR/RpiR family transcriptional regulator [Companilactobacillus halodurans]
MQNNINILIKSYYDNLTGTSKDIADYLLTHPQTSSSLTITDLAKKTNSSISSISRFAKKLGFNSFQELKINLLTSQTRKEDGNHLFQEINSNDSTLEMAKKVFTSNISALNATLDTLTQEELDKAIKIISDYDTIAFFGLGASALVALDGYHKFLRSDKTPLFANDFHMQLMLATTLKKNTCAIVISHSGENKDTLELAQKLREKNIKTIGITSYGNSALTKIVDLTLLSISEETKYQNEALHAIIAQISLIDTLFVLTAMKDDQQTTNIFKEIRKTINDTRN